MISDKYKCIFIHIERTGGTSIERALFGITSDKAPPIDKEIKHLTAKESLEHYGEDKWNKYFKFSIVRNPWDLVVSNFFFPWFHGPGDHIDFKSWVQQLKADSNKVISHKRTPQLKAVSINGSISIDYIIRFETLKEQWEEVRSKLGVSYLLTNNWNHRLKKYSYLKDRKPYPYYYDDETISIVAERFKRDIDYFGYKFGENINKV